MWTQTISPATFPASAELIKEFVEMTPAPKDRPLQERRMKAHEESFRKGTFRSVTWAKCYCKETNKTYRINGKHTSLLLSRLETVPELFVTVEQFYAETLEDVARLYATYDNRIVSRTGADINRSYAGTMPELEAIPTRLLSAIVSGIAYHQYRDSYTSIPAADRAEKLFEMVPFAQWCHRLCGEHESKYRHIFKVPVVGAMLGSYETDEGDATRFWSDVREDGGAHEADAPTRRLAKLLLISSVHGDPNRGARGRTLSNREFYVKCAHAWNAYREHRTTDMKYYAAADIPKFI